MSDHNCVDFMQWALPQLELHWPGFRRVRGQVCKRLKRRIGELNIADFAAYRDYLAKNPEEWIAVDSYCRITISRFFRNKGLFGQLSDVVLPALARRAGRETRSIRCWSIGCASGEEVYSLKILWEQSIRASAPDVAFSIVGTDIDETVLHRARKGCYERSTLRELPQEWTAQCFEVDDGHYCIKEDYRSDVSFHRQDIREATPSGEFDIVLCRNLVFTYFLPTLQEKVLNRISRTLRADGFLVVGAHEQLPPRALNYHHVPGCRDVFQRHPST